MWAGHIRKLSGPRVWQAWDMHNPSGGRDFQHQTGPGAYPASCTMGTGSFPGVKRPGRGVDHPPPSSAEVKERVELYLYSPSGPSWPVLGWTLPLPLPLPFTPTSFHAAHGDFTFTPTCNQSRHWIVIMNMMITVIITIIIVFKHADRTVNSKHKQITTKGKTEELHTRASKSQFR
jgi:hypothetical protein